MDHEQFIFYRCSVALYGALPWSAPFMGVFFLRA